MKLCKKVSFFIKKWLKLKFDKGEIWHNPNTFVLPPKDERIESIFGITKSLFEEISFDLFGLLICQYLTFSIFYVYFTGFKY